MIYTVTFNPALDCVMHIDQVVFGAVNRSEYEELHFGGKGVTVSSMLTHLGRRSVAWGFVAGFTGHAMLEALQAKGVNCDFVYVPKGATRINVKLQQLQTGSSSPRIETAINAAGPCIDGSSINQFFDKLRAVRPGDIVVLSGGLPSQAPPDLYAQVMRALEGIPQVRVIVDASKHALLESLVGRPYLIKPNHEELQEIFSCDNTFDDLREVAFELQRLGAQHVLVSRGAKGAFLLDTQGNILEQPPFKGTLVNSVGAGDSMVAGFIHGLLTAEEAQWNETDTFRYALYWAQACGAATAFSQGIATKEYVEQLLASMPQQGLSQGAICTRE